MAYSLVAIADGQVIGVRDPLGVRPLILGKVGNTHVLASETVALDIMGAELVRDIDPGEMVILSETGVTSFHPFPPTPQRFCVFEYIYFARPDSTLEGRSVYQARKAIGAELALESPVDGDLVVPVPDSGVPAAIGFAEQSGLPFEIGIVRNHYVGRTFIEPTDQIRHLGVKLKHNANPRVLQGRRVRAGRRQHRPRHDIAQNRRDGPSRRGRGGPYAHLKPADPAPLFLRDRHTGPG